MAEETEVAEVPEVKQTDWAETVLKEPTPEPQMPAVQKQEPEPARTELKGKIPDALFAKKPEQAEHVSEVDQIKAPDFKGEAAKKGWDVLHSKAKSLEDKARALEQELLTTKEGSKKYEGIEAKIADYEKRLAEVTAKADEYQGIVRKVSIDADPEFRKLHIEGRNALVAEGKQIADESDVDAGAIEAALLLPEGKARTKAIEAAMDGMSNFQQGRIGEILTKISRLDREAASKRGDPNEFFKQQEATRKQQQDEASRKFAEDSARAYSTAERDLSENLIVLRRLDGDENKWWNDQGDKIKTEARKFWETNHDPRKAAELVIKGHAAELYEQAYQDVRGELTTTKAKLAEREKELEKLYGTGPKTDGSGAAPNVMEGAHNDWASQAAKAAGWKT